MSDVQVSYRSPEAGPNPHGSEIEGWSEILGPLLAGARARGVADALDLLGVAAVLLDGTGRVLHASGRAVRAISPLIRVVEDHLVGHDPASNALLQALVASSVAAEPRRTETRFFDPEGRPCLFVRAVPFPRGLADEPQLLKTVLIVDAIEL